VNVSVHHAFDGRMEEFGHQQFVYRTGNIRISQTCAHLAEKLFLKRLLWRLEQAQHGPATSEDFKVEMPWPAVASKSSGSLQSIPFGAFAQYYLRAGVDVTKLGANNETLLHWTTLVGSIECVEYLVQKGLSLNAKDSNDITPLHLAVFRGDAAMVRHLIKLGADVTQRDESNLTPLDLARQYREYEIVSLLGKQPVDPIHPLVEVVEKLRDVCERLKGVRVVWRAAAVHFLAQPAQQFLFALQSLQPMMPSLVQFSLQHERYSVELDPCLVDTVVQLCKLQFTKPVSATPQSIVRVRSHSKTAKIWQEADTWQQPGVWQNVDFEGELRKQGHVVR
jgi:hypothetical protein